jgi:hypothetical protein
MGLRGRRHIRVSELHQPAYRRSSQREPASCCCNTAAGRATNAALARARCNEINVLVTPPSPADHTPSVA